MLSSRALFGRAHPRHPVFGKPAPNRPQFLTHSTLDNSPVFSLDVMLPKKLLQMSLDLLGFCKNQQATDKLVQPVNDEEFVVSVLQFHVLAQVGIGGLLAFVESCNRQQAGGLMNYQQVIVFVEDRQAVELALRHALARYLKAIARLNRLVGDLDRRAIEPNASTAQQLAKRAVARSWRQKPESFKNNTTL